MVIALGTGGFIWSSGTRKLRWKFTKTIAIYWELNVPVPGAVICLHTQRRHISSFCIKLPEYEFS
jgi:hypothetical protein